MSDSDTISLRIFVLLFPGLSALSLQLHHNLVKGGMSCIKRAVEKGTARRAPTEATPVQIYVGWIMIRVGRRGGVEPGYNP